MENASKALQMAAGVLLAVMLLSLVVYGFKQFGILPQQEDDNKKIEQIAKFNREFEVYNKSRMYGVDVISCLNKVQSYNEKYVLKANESGEKQLKYTDETGEHDSTGFYVGSNTIGDEFKINVAVTINEPLEEELRAYRIDERTGKSVEIFSGHTVHDDTRLNVIFPQSTFEYTRYSANDQLGATIRDHKTYVLDGPNYMLGGQQYWLYQHEGGAYDDKLTRLISCSNGDTNLKLIAKNRLDNEEFDYTDWSEVVWYTALYDLKTRQFGCDELHYNPDTNQIDWIIFSER